MQREIMEIPLSQIKPDPLQPRKVFDEDELAELAKSIENNGLLQPISVMPNGTGYIIIAGERRYRAHQLLDRETIDCIIFEGSEDQAKAMQLLENIVRKDLNPLEVAQAYQSYLDRGYSKDDLSDILGKGKGRITWHMGLLNAREDIQYLVARGQLSLTVGVELGRLTHNGQGRALRMMQEAKLNPSECVQLCQKIWAEENQVDMFPETKLSPEEIEARHKVKSAIDKACAAIAEVNEIEKENPGVTASAIATELETTEEKVKQLMTGLRILEKNLTQRKVALIMG